MYLQAMREIPKDDFMFPNSILLYLHEQATYPVARFGSSSDSFHMTEHYQWSSERSSYLAVLSCFLSRSGQIGQEDLRIKFIILRLMLHMEN